MSLYIKTPLLPMGARGDRSVHLKMENLQPPGSFKLRGIEALCRESLAAGAVHLVSSSGGNAGLATAYVGRELGMRTTIILPKTTPAFVVEMLRGYGAQVTIQGEAWDEANVYALSLAQAAGAAYIPPFDHPTLWRGHATMVDELKADCPQQPDLIILSVGGGGLLCGVVEGLVRNGWGDTHILAVETEGAASLHRAVEAGALVKLPAITTTATSLGAKQVAAQALAYAQALPILPHLVTDEAANRACVRFLQEQRTMVEPACGASLSVVYDGAPILEDYRNIVVIVCGGAVVSAEKILGWKAQYGM